ncbi:MAG: hypothetical protein GKR94_26780 [Gammaproteobacteria bacterium]|nr:hypothetical protein [Gammaproteobacteria bacterium]
MKLKSLQRLLENIYGVRVQQQVDDFLVTDAHIAAQIDRSHNPRGCEEKLLVLQEDGELLLSLFIDEQVLNRLHRDNPWDTLSDGNLSDFCIALEGVSHFLYLTHRAQQHRTVTLLELELQAEVDKYVSVHALLSAQGAAVAPRILLRRLFETVRFDEDLNKEELVRYEDANSLAGTYCRHLESRYLGCRSSYALVSEIRTFYQLGQPEKVRRISNAPAL